MDSNAWLDLAATPLLGLSMTLLAYLAGQRLYRLSGETPLCHPVAIAILALIAFLSATGMPYRTYFEGAQFVHILTGITGAVSGSTLFAVLRLRDPGLQGLALGVASHGIGTARAFPLSEESGAFAGIGMGLNALLTTAPVPLAEALVLAW